MFKRKHGEQPVEYSPCMKSFAEAIFIKAEVVSSIIFFTGTKPPGNLVIKYSTHFSAKKKKTKQKLYKSLVDIMQPEKRTETIAYWLNSQILWLRIE